MKTICGRGNSEPSRLMEQSAAGDEGDGEKEEERETNYSTNTRKKQQINSADGRIFLK